MARSIPVKKFWTVTLTKKSKPKSPKTPTTAKEQLDVKIKTVSTQLSANFNNCAHLLRHELSKSTWAENQNDPEYLSRIFHNRIDSLWLENLRDFVCYITLSTLRSLTNSSNMEPFQRPDTLTKLRDSIPAYHYRREDSLYDIWQFFFDESFQEFIGSYGTIDVGGTEYRINKNTFQAVAISPDGNFIDPENVSEKDRQMLELMKKRDSLPVDSEERASIEAQLEDIYESIPKPERNVDPSNPYDYYILGGDITEQLNEYMRQTEVKYEYMHNRYWLNNLLEFRNTVGLGMEMDLKNQPEWQHSAFIYDGEIIDQDAAGNINYGFFGTYCNIPESVLMVGAGYAQWRAGNTENEFWFTFFDAPGIHTEHFRELIFIMNGTNHHETHSRTNSRKCVLHSTSQRIHEHFHQSDNRSCIHIPQTNRYRPASNNIRTPHKLSAILH